MPTVSAWNIETISPKQERAIRLLALDNINPRPLDKANRTRLTIVEDPPVDPDHWRPRTRADCATFARPCPYIGCKYHNVHTMGWLSDNDDAVLLLIEQLGEDSCALDVAERQSDHSESPLIALSTDRLARILNITRQGVEQIIERTTRKLSRRRELRDLHEQSDAPNECIHGYYGAPTPAIRYEHFALTAQDGAV